MNTQIIKILSKYWLNITQDKIEEKYSEPHRYYHVFSHPSFIIEKINEMSISGVIDEEESDILILSALFHDIVYNPQKTDNEHQSVLFLRFIQNEECKIITKVKEIILATKTHTKTGDKLVDMFLDLDMYNLSNGSFTQILSDERNIFKEYQFVDYELYKTERIKFLNGVLNQDYGIKNETNIKMLIEWVDEGYRDSDGYLFK